MPTAHSIVVSTHGRYLVEPSAEKVPDGLLVGFHGYGESAEVQLARLKSIAGSDRWLRVSIQGLHRFYRGRSNDVVASWMTRQDRELVIADNIAYVSAVVDAVARDVNTVMPIVFSGFSQGVAMAFRSACLSKRRAAGVVAVGGDVPPELSAEALARIPMVILARGTADEWYTAEKWEADQKRLRSASVELHTVGFEGGHEWHDEVNARAASLLPQLSRRRSSE